jgi:hypothetical protein
MAGAHNMFSSAAMNSDVKSQKWKNINI